MANRSSNTAAVPEAKGALDKFKFEVASEQFTEMIERGDMDMVIFFYNPTMINPKEPDVYKIIRTCDQYNIPIATNIGTAESLILGLARGDLDWREQLKAD